jgi:O-antigen ligase
MGLYVTINYITSFERLNRFSNLVFWSTAALCLYGAYDFVTALFGLHFYSIIYDLSYYAGGIDSPYFSFGDVSIPRPRSTLGEPSNFADFLLFGIPFTIASLSLEKSTVLRIVKVGIVFLGCMLFVVANSRAALLAIPVIFIAVLWLAPSKIYRLRMLLALGVIYLLIAFVIFPMAGGEADALSPVHYYKERMASLTNIGANLRAEPEGASIGRGYSTPLGIFKDHPIWGVGLGNYPFYYTEFVGSDIIVMGSPFSLYFRLLTELGIVGTSLFLLFVATMLWRLLRFIISIPRDSINLRLRPFALAALIAIIGVMIARVGLDGLCTDSHIWVMLGVGVVIPWLAKRSPAVAKLDHPLATD